MCASAPLSSVPAARVSRSPSPSERFGIGSRSARICRQSPLRHSKSVYLDLAIGLRHRYVLKAPQNRCKRNSMKRKMWRCRDGVLVEYSLLFSNKKPGFRRGIRPLLISAANSAEGRVFSAAEFPVAGTRSGALIPWITASFRRIGEVSGGKIQNIRCEQRNRHQSKWPLRVALVRR
jgi:hypothetical protein